MAKSFKKNFVLFWNSDNCGNSYKELLAWEKSEQGGASSSIQLAEGVKACDVMQAIYNESNADLAFLEYTLTELVTDPVQAIYQEKCRKLCLEYTSKLCLDVDQGSGDLDAISEAVTFCQGVTSGYQNINIIEPLDMFEYLHHLEMTLQNKHENT